MKTKASILTTKQINVTITEEELQEAICMFIQRRAEQTGNADLLDLDWDNAIVNVNHDISERTLIETNVRLTVDQYSKIDI